jgi:hypothetical protein
MLDQAEVLKMEVADLSKKFTGYGVFSCVWTDTFLNNI